MVSTLRRSIAVWMFAGVLLAIGSLASPAVAQVVSGHLFGLTLSNNGGSPNTTIDVAAGDATDSTNTYSMQLASAFSKVLQTSGSWTAGTGNNGLDTGARAANTWYHVYLIRKDADGTSDVLFSTSVSSPTMPSGYTAFRRIGSVRTNGSNNIFAFTQTGDEFIWSTASYDVQGVNVGTTSTQYTLSVPSGVKVIARVRAVNDPTGTTTSQITIRSPDESTSQNSTFVTGSGHQLQAHSGNSIATEVLVRTNTASQVAAISNVASGNVFHVRTVGWFDGRGK